MRANSAVREPELQELWASQDIYRQLSRNNSGPVFTLHDGPPYANGALHMGHALNKILKDIINKYQLMRGRRVRFVPGWDCHGLPIELKVLQSLSGEERRGLDPVQLRRKAATYAMEQVEQQRSGFRRWGIWAEWDQPYLTLDRGYEAAQLEVFGRMVLAGHIYRGLKPVHWSPSSRTALAEAELEYPDGHTSPSVFVAFPVHALSGELRRALDGQGLTLPDDGQDLAEQLSLAIWTTTPWTLPGNQAVSVNGRLEYAISSGGDGQPLLVVAAERLEALRDQLGLPLQPLARVRGEALAGTRYRLPLFEREAPVVLGGEYITTDSGTGLVHTAPGHGSDDFITGSKHGLPMLCPVDEAGVLTEEAGRFAGLNVLRDANAAISGALREEGALLLEQPYAHRYPYDWRTKKPTIFRATEQWFASLDGFRDQALAAIAEVEWLPASGRNRIEAMVRERGDWCISRQRSWGVPIPVFYERETGEVLLNADTLRHVQALVRERGSDVWWEEDERVLLPAPYDREWQRWRKGSDTMDVWFDSGSSWAAVSANREGLRYPADLVLEGSDQHRGWFQSSLLTSVAVNGRAPYRRVLTHGFTLDETGRKMSKSLGNVVDPNRIIQGGSNQKQEPAYGADVLRLWVSSVDTSSDVPIGKTMLRQLADVYRKLRNTARYLLGNLHDYDPRRDAVPPETLPLLDRWMLHRCAEVNAAIQRAYETHELFHVVQTLQQFCVVDLSNFYLDIAKDRLYVSEAAAPRRRSCQTVMALMLEQLAGLIAPVLSHMAEDIWQSLPYAVSERSVFLRGWPEADPGWLTAGELTAPVQRLRELRGQVNRALETIRSEGRIGSSLEVAVHLVVEEPALLEAMALLERRGDPEVDRLRDWLLVSQLTWQPPGSAVDGEGLLAEQREPGVTLRLFRAEGTKCDRCWHVEPSVGRHSDHPGLCDRCWEVMQHQMTPAGQGAAA
ncbi:isoleucine--tRNA ligase [Synechococcus sp. RSCCF101]|uniref:isoleucine--tRNA ligase n=1 Tax=Synechococcus sp. RSCCF101 TaxID=2511069 RepID=UPI001CD9CD32|nr:isoleucine--tRNA ligase [Synechococcus sp. RSCCF101]